MLKNEVKQMCESWQSLEDQKAKKVINLAQKEETIGRLTVEKARMEGKLNTVHKQNTLFNNNMVLEHRKMVTIRLH